MSYNLNFQIDGSVKISCLTPHLQDEDLGPEREASGQGAPGGRCRDPVWDHMHRLGAGRTPRALSSLWFCLDGMRAFVLKTPDPERALTSQSSLESVPSLSLT